MEHHHLVSILKASFDACLLVDENGSILYVNSLARDFLGVRDPEHYTLDELFVFLNRNNNRTCFMDMTQTPEETITLLYNQESMEKTAEVKIASVDTHTFLLFLRPVSNDLLASHVLAGILDAALDPLFQVNEHGIIQLVNKAATTQFGWTRDEFLGNNISMIVGSEHADKHDGYMKRYLETGEAHVMGTKRELSARRKDGSEFIIQLSLVEVDVPVEYGDERMFCGFILDLTEQKQLSSRIETERNLVKGILDASLDPLFQINERGIIQLVNKAATRQFGWTREEFIGNNISMICGEEHASKHDTYMERYLQTGETRVMGTKRILPARRKDGSEFTIQLSLVEVDVPVEHGEERLFCGFILDLTDQMELQQWIETFPGIKNRV